MKIVGMSQFGDSSDVVDQLGFSEVFPPIFDDDHKAHLNNRLYFLLKMINILPCPRSSSAAAPKVVYKSLYLLRHNCRLPALFGTS